MPSSSRRATLWVLCGAAVVAVLIGSFLFVADDIADSGGMRDDGRGTTDDTAGARPRRSGGDHPSEIPATVPAASRPESASPSESADPYGSLVIGVRRKKDGHPVADCPLSIVPFGEENALSRTIRRVTDAQGEATIEKIHTGVVAVYALFGGSASTTVLSGKRSTVEVIVPEGDRVVGRVVDEMKNPMAGAKVWLSSFGSMTEGADVATSGADGTFEIASVAGLGFQYLAARHPHSGPSGLYRPTVTRDAEYKVEIVLSSVGVELSGTVRGPDGEPVAGASVVAGPSPYFNSPDPEVAHGSSPFTGETDNDGRFSFVGLAPVEMPIGVRMPGAVPWRTTVKPIDGHFRPLEISLAAGARISGIVVDSADQGVAGAEVAIGETGEFSSSTAMTNNLGRFTLTGVSPGEITLMASKRSVGKGQVKLTVADLEAPSTVIKIDAGRIIRGRVIGADDRPIEDRLVQCATEAGAPNAVSARTDEEGRFRFINREDRPHRIWIPARGRPLVSLAEKKGVAPSTEEILLRIEKDEPLGALIKGVFRDVHGNPLPGLQAFVEKVGSGETTSLTIDPETGAFESTRVSAGSYRVQAIGAWSSAEKTLVDDETWDLGVVTIERPGKVKVILDRGGATAILFVFLKTPGESMLKEMVTVAGDSARSGPLPPGEYEAWGEGEGVLGPRVRFRLSADEEKEVRFSVVRAFSRFIPIEEPTDAATIKYYAVKITRASDAAVVDEFRAERPKEGLPAIDPKLPEGRYVITMTAPDGRSGTATFDFNESSEKLEASTIVIR